MSNLRFLVFLTLVSLPSLRGQDAPAPPATFFFEDGDNPAVILGDSITEQRMYSRLIETYTLTRFPDYKITFRNAGWSGDTAWLSQRGDFDSGLQRDVLSLKPKAVTIDFGMNDARGGDGTYSKYLEYQTKLVKALKDAGARVALITPSPEERYQPDAPAGSHYNEVLKKYADGLQLVADNEKAVFIDQYTPFVKVIEAGRKAGILATTEGAGARLIPDGIHPNWGGHLIMATAILQGLHAPAEVSSVTVDAASKSITSSEGCTVEWQDAPEGAVQIKRADRSLPWPIPADPMIDTVLKIPGFDPATALNRYLLKVTGLSAPSYNLNIDGQFVANYTSADLAAGVNLGWVNQGPIYDQGQQLLKAVMAKNDAYFNRWRNVQCYTPPAWLNFSGLEDRRTAEIKRLDALIADAEKSIDVLRKPAPHIFKLDPVK